MSVEINETNFPGGWLRGYVAQYDLDHDGWLSDEELAAVTSISIGTSTAGKGSMKGIEFFTELITLVCAYASFRGVSFSSFKKLESLQIGASYEGTYDNNEDWDFSACSSLKDIALKYVHITTIKFPQSIENIDIKCTNRSSLVLFPVNLEGCSALTSFKIEPNSTNRPSPIRGLNNKPNLETVDLSSEYLSGMLDFSGDTALKKIRLYGVLNETSPYSATLDLTGCTALTELDFRAADNLIGTLDLSTLSSLETVECQGTGFTGLTLGPANQNLSKLLVYGLPDKPTISSIDISDCPKLVELFETSLPAQRSDYSTNVSYYAYGSETSSNAFFYDVRTSVTDNGIVVTSQPESVSIEEGEEYAFTFSVTGSNISYSWQKRMSPSDLWTTLEDDDGTYSGVGSLSDNGAEFRCIASNNISSVTSNIVKLTILLPPAIVTSPLDASATENDTVSFTVSANGDEITYKWQFSSDNGINWTDIRNSDSNTYNLIATLSVNGYLYRCIVSNGIGEATSDPATLTVTPDTSVTPPAITTQPASTTVAEGSSATFAVEVSGSDISYQWQVFKNNQWTNIQNATSASYTTVGTRSADGNRYRCVISNAAGAVYSDPATLTVTMGVYVSTPRVLTQPRSVNVELGELVTFWIRADGGDLSYQWQKLNNGTWYDITGATSASYAVMARTEVHNTQYRCVVTNTAGSVISSTTTLSIRSGHDLSFYGYHSIIISGKNTYGEWEMYPTSRPHVAPPEVKTSYVDLPGADGGLDYTDLLTGEPRYGYRKGSWEFLLIPQDRWAAVYRSLVNFLHGKQHTVILEDDPNYVYTGRLSVNEWQSAAHNSLITIDYILEPFPRNISGQEEDEEENQILSMASTLLNKEKYAGMVIGKLNGAATLIYPDMLFDNGDNIAY